MSGLSNDESLNLLHLSKFMIKHKLSIPIPKKDNNQNSDKKQQQNYSISTSIIPNDDELVQKLDSLKELIKKMKSEKTTSKAEIEAKVEELEEIKSQLPEAKGGFNEKEKANYEKKRAKLDRARFFQDQAEKAKDKKDEKKPKKESAPPPPVQTYLPGKKKDVSGKLFEAYHPQNVEAVWDSWWNEKKLFSPSAMETGKEKFIMVIPPPNVTGSLHIGHALTCAIEDAITRWHRMQGHQTLWLPGTDHAGIATQMVVEKQMQKEWELDNSKPKNKLEIGREKFLERVWEFKNEKGNTILSQIRRLGASVDHTRTVFTMDDQNNRAVVEAFVRLFEGGKIYRETRLVHWSYALKTAISSIEVDDEELDDKNSIRKVPGHKGSYKFGVFHNFAYKIHPDDLKEGMPSEIMVATTRLETMLGDVAVAVHPKDDRYKSIHGVRLVHPYHPERDFRVVVDEMVEIDLGTGAVKITPAHDENDFQAAKRVGIDSSQFYSIFNDDGAISVDAAGNAPELGNMMRYDARVWIMKDLEKKGLFRGETPNPKQILPICSRSGDIVEPRLIPQWWVDCREMAARACDAVKNGELKIVPAFHEAVWFEWLNNIQPWCVSRQLWWGHRIPAWRLANSSDKEPKWFVARNEQDARERARQELKLESVDQVPELVQDEDVLDTWFSSGLFPFASFGWPNLDSPDLKAFFPGQLLETGQDILFFWVARMVMMSLALTDQLPFKTVYLHGMVRDKEGRKMSKTLGNVVDPVDVMEGRSLSYLTENLRRGNLGLNEVLLAEKGLKQNFPQGFPECGADALRFGLLAYTKQERNINLDVDEIHGYRTFCNKIWNICRFCEGLVDKVFSSCSDFKAVPVQAVTRRDKWILHRLALCVKECNDGFKSYSFHAVTTALYQFWYNYLADVYVETCKPIFYEDKDGDSEKITCLNTLYACLDSSLRLLHPIMPFLTEELWQHLPGHPSDIPESLCVAAYPKEQDSFFAAHLQNTVVEEEMKLVLEVTKAFRGLISPILAKLGGQVAKKAKMFLILDNENKLDQESLRDIGTLCKVDSLPTKLKKGEKEPEGMVEVIGADVKLIVVVEGGAINTEAELAKLKKKEELLQKEIAELNRRAENPEYVQQAKPEVIAKDQKKLTDLQKSLESVYGEMSKIKG